MRNDWVVEPLGKFIKQTKRKIKVQAGIEYPAIGVMMEGRGFVTRPPFVGGITTYKHLTPIEANQLVLRSITAWEAPIQVTTQEHTGFHVSGVFPVFDIDSSMLEPRFLSLLCRHEPFWESMRERTVGSVLRRKTLSATSLMEIPIHLPPLSEQKRIVDLILSVDSHIAHLKHLLKVAEKSRNAVLQELMAKDGDGRTEYKFKNVATAVKGKLPSSKNKGGIGIPYLTASYLRSNKPDYWIENVDGAITAEDGDCLILWDGAGAGDLFTAKHGVVSSTMAVITTHNSEISREFLTLYISSKSEYIKETCRGTTVPHVSPDAIANMDLKIPPLVEQKRIIEIMASMREMIEKTENLFEKAIDLQSGMLSDLLSGEHEIPVTYDGILGVNI